MRVLLCVVLTVGDEAIFTTAAVTQFPPFRQTLAAAVATALAVWLPSCAWTVSAATGRGTILWPLQSIPELGFV